MNTLALMAAVVAAQVDGGTPDAGPPALPPIRVVAAQPVDGGTLPAGWWLSGERLKKVGAHTVKLGNDLAQCQHEKDELANVPCGPTVSLGFWAGIVLGAAAGVGGTIFVVRQIEK